MVTARVPHCRPYLTDRLPLAGRLVHFNGAHAMATTRIMLPVTLGNRLLTAQASMWTNTRRRVPAGSARVPYFATRRRGPGALKARPRGNSKTSHAEGGDSLWLSRTAHALARFPSLRIDSNADGRKSGALADEVTSAIDGVVLVSCNMRRCRPCSITTRTCPWSGPLQRHCVLERWRALRDVSGRAGVVGRGGSDEAMKKRWSKR